MPNLTSEGGHDFVYHCCVQKICQQLSLNFHGFFPVDAKLHTIPDDWTPLFRAKKWRIIDFMIAFYKDRGRQQIFFLESFSARDLFAVTAALILIGKKRHFFWLFFRYDLSFLSKRRGLYLLLSKLLKLKLGSRFVALTDSELIRESFAPHLDLKVMPIPHADLTPVPNKKNEKLVLWWPGAPRPAKGLKEIQKLSERLRDAELVVASSTPDVTSARRIADVLTREEYRAQMAEADVILLPYDPIVYRASTSGILIEAIIAGKMPVVRDGSWLSHELNRFGLNELVIDWSNEDVLREIFAVYRDPTVRKKLEKMRESYQSTHSLEAYKQKMAALISNLQTGSAG